MTAIPARLRGPEVSLPAIIVGIAVVAVAAAALVAVATSGGLSRPPASAGAPIPINPAIESKWGIRVSQVAVTADGGLVDFRFIVLDPDKAAEMLSNVDNLPVLLPDGASVVVNSTAQMGAHPTLRAGQTYFLLYRNAGGTVRSGDALSVLFGDLKIEHVIAR